ASIEALEWEADRGQQGTVLAMLTELVGLGQSRLEPLFQPPAPVPVHGVVGTAGEPSCPKCSSGRIVRSHSHTAVERLRKRLTDRRLFRCDTCNWRGWLLPPNAVEAVPIDPPVVPDLTPIDFAVAPQATAHRAMFSPRDLS